MNKVLRILSVILLWAVAAYSYADNDHNRAKKLMDSGDILPLESILKTARETHAGKIIEIELEVKHKRPVYELELLTPQGKVVELIIDARTGMLISTQEED